LALMFNTYTDFNLLKINSSFYTYVNVASTRFVRPS
jgi:hypothetical protein